LHDKKKITQPIGRPLPNYSFSPKNNKKKPSILEGNQLLEYSISPKITNLIKTKQDKIKKYEELEKKLNLSSEFL